MEKNILAMIEDLKFEIESLKGNSDPRAIKLVESKKADLISLEKEYKANEKYYVLERIQTAITKADAAKEIQKFLVKESAPDCKVVLYYADGNISINMRPLTIRSLKSSSITRNAYALPDSIGCNLFAKRVQIKHFKRISEIEKGMRFENFNEAFRAVLACYENLTQEFDSFCESNDRYNVGSNADRLKNLTRGVHDIRNFFTVEKSNLEIVTDNANEADDNED